jgi:C4-dicarboxylate-specific signal transduction histidine kinase
LRNVVAAIRDHNANDFIPKTAEFKHIITRIRLAWENARRMQQLVMLEEEFRALLRTRAARTYAEDVAALLRRFKASLHRVTEQLKSYDGAGIAAAADALKREFNSLNDEFMELTNLLSEGQERQRPIDVVGLVQQMILLYQRMLDSVHAEVLPSHGAQSVVLTTYEGDLKVALHEVITNAVYALEDSDTPAKERKLSITVNPIEQGAVIQVKDNGSGFSNEAMDHMFDRGYTTRNGQHQGLGLYIAKRMMSQIGGGIAVQNCVEGGAEVKLVVQNLGSP